MSLQVERRAYFDAHRRAFGPLTQPQVDGVNTLLDGMARDAALTDVRHAAYMLATTWHETAHTLQPIAERGPRHYFDRYDPVRANTATRRQRARQMGNTREGDGFRFRGRGYVQLTWHVNYEKASALVGVDLLAHPDRAMEPEIAYQIMSHGMRVGWFTGRRLSDFIHAERVDYVNARRIINGLDRAALIAAHARQFEAALRQGMSHEPD